MSNRSGREFERWHKGDYVMVDNLDDIPPDNLPVTQVHKMVERLEVHVVSKVWDFRGRKIVEVDGFSCELSWIRRPWRFGQFDKVIITNFDRHTLGYPDYTTTMEDRCDEGFVWTIRERKLRERVALYEVDDMFVVADTYLEAAFKESAVCSECKGTGWYTGLQIKEPCSYGCEPKT